MRVAVVGAGPKGLYAVEELLARVTPDRLDTYEALLRALADSELWMLLWQGDPGEPDAHYGGIEVAGHGYAPCVTSGPELTASGPVRSRISTISWVSAPEAMAIGTRAAAARIDTDWAGVMVTDVHDAASRETAMPRASRPRWAMVFFMDSG